MLLRSIAAAALGLWLGACVQRDYLVANPSDGSRPSGEMRYTNNLAYVSSFETIPLRIEPVFAPDERQEIMRAVMEWNHALNGHVRFEPVLMAFQPVTSMVDARVGHLEFAPPRSNAWSVMPLRGATPLGRHVAMPMALTQAAPNGGGVVMIYRENTGVPELASAIRHELGHVLGLMHDPPSRLMSPMHDPAAQLCIDAAQLCIDKATMVAVAHLRGLTLDELNWCEETPRSVTGTRADT